MKRDANNRVRVEVTEATLLRLLTGGHACAADFHCLDCESKKCLWRLCLQSCKKPSGIKNCEVAAGMKDVAVFKRKTIEKDHRSSRFNRHVGPVLLESA
jgi:hypothetical protein